LHLSRQASLSIEESQKLVDRAMHIYYEVKHVLTKDQIKELSIYDKLFLPGKMILADFGKALEDPSSKYYDDFNDIRNHVLEHASANAMA